MPVPEKRPVVEPRRLLALFAVFLVPLALAVRGIFPACLRRRVLSLRPLLLDCRAFLLGWGLSRCLLLRRRWAGPFLLPPGSWGLRRGLLLQRRCAGAFLLSPGRLLRRPLLLDILLPAVTRRFLRPCLSRRGRSLHVLLVMLPNCGVAWLVAITLSLKRLLLVYRPGIPIS